MEFRTMKVLCITLVASLVCSVTLAVDTVAELQKQRQALLVKQQDTAVAIAEAAQKAYDEGKGDLKELLSVYKDVVDVRLLLASSPSMRIFALEEYVKSLSAIESKIADAERPIYDPQRPIVPVVESDQFRQIKFANQSAKIALIDEKLQNAPPKISKRVPHYDELIEATNSLRQ
jgi:Na+-transporting NADH:ubiquinone oxidoreductase subunit NqrC